VAGVAGFFLSLPVQKVSAQTITLDRSMLALLPAEATSLFGVNVERLKQTTTYQYIEDTSRKMNPSGQSHLDDIANLTGFDPRRDVQELLVASWAAPAAATATPPAPGIPNVEPQFVAVARGQFNITGIQAALRLKGARSETYRGFELLAPEHAPASAQAAPRRVPRRNRNGGQDQPENGPRSERALTPPRPQGVFTFLDTTTVLAGTRPAVMAAIDRKLAGGPSLINNTALLARAQAVGASSQIWAASQNPGDMVARAMPQGAAGQNSNFLRIFAGMQNTSLSVDLMNGLDLRAAGICKTPDDAKTLADAARGLVAIGRLSVSQQQPEMLALFDGLDVTQSNAELDISVKLDSATFQKILQKRTAPKGQVVGFTPGR
jgi:hypothetical protein